MSRIIRSPGLTRASGFLLAAFWLVPVDLPLFPDSLGLVRSAAAQYLPQVPDGQQFPFVPDLFGQPPGDDLDMPRASRSSKAKAARKKARAAEKGTAKKADGKAQSKDAGSQDKTKAAGSGQVTFAQDIAPILVANCVGCHTPGQQGVRRGKLDLTTFEKIKKGTPDHKIIVAGKPEESHLILRIKGEERPRMPLGNNGALSAAAIAKIEQWVKSGAAPGAGVDSSAALNSYAASPEQLRREQLAKTPVAERDKAVTDVGLKRWSQANAALKPEVVPGEHFIVFSNLPKDRATSTLKAMERPLAQLRGLLGTLAMNSVEKISLYVFSTPKDFTEFVRSVEGHDIDPDEHSSANLGIPQPYVAVLDPAGGKREESAGRRRARTKKGEDRDSGGSQRSLLGVLTEGLGSGAIAPASNDTRLRWLRVGISTYLASRVEPQSPYYRQLRLQAFQNFDQGWQTKATETLGGGNQIAAADLRAVSFALVEAMMTTEMSRAFPAFLRGMLVGEGNLDDLLQNVYGGNREQFLSSTGEWVAAHYGNVQ
jgi:mono/diheme cytochrome c family protein